MSTTSVVSYVQVDISQWHGSYALTAHCRVHGYEIGSTRKAKAPSLATAASFRDLLTFCRLNKCCVHFVIVFNLTRFARDKYDPFALRSPCSRFDGSSSRGFGTRVVLT